MSLKISLLTLSVAGLSFTTIAREFDLSKVPPASSRKDVTFAKDIKPIFDQSCVKCHGAEKPKAKLRLDSLDAVLKGSADGKVIEPGSSAKSGLLASVAHLGEEDEWMPPVGNKLKIKALTKEEVGLVRAWIEQGAK